MALLLMLLLLLLLLVFLLSLLFYVLLCAHVPAGLVNDGATKNWNNKQLPFSERSSQLQITYDASKEASNQQVYVRMLGSSIKLSLLSELD